MLPCLVPVHWVGKPKDKTTIKKSGCNYTSTFFVDYLHCSFIHWMDSILVMGNRQWPEVGVMTTFLGALTLFMTDMMEVAEQVSSL